MKIDRSDLSLRLVEERTRLGFSQADFANKLGMSREGLRLNETGQRGISAEFLAQAATLGVDVQYVLTGVASANRAELPRAEAPQASAQVNMNGGSGHVGVVNGGKVKVDNWSIHTEKVIHNTKAEVKPGEAHISEDQAATLTRLVNEIVDLEGKAKKVPKTHRAVWAALNANMKVTRYRLIPLEGFDKAEKYLRQWLGRLNAAPSASKNDGDAWRKRKYAYIKINSKDEPEKIDNYIKKNFRASSLTDLSNEELEQTYRYAASLKKAKK